VLGEEPGGDRWIETLPAAATDSSVQSRKKIIPALHAALGVVPALALPDRPSIAVLPFQNMSGEADQEYFADGIVEDIITALSRFSNLFVIARNSSFTYKGQTADVTQVGQELGVRYVLRAACASPLTGCALPGSS